MIAEITLSHLLRLANEHRCFVSRKQALKFLNEQGHAFEMWKQMMQAGEDFIARSLLGQSTSRQVQIRGRLGPQARNVTDPHGEQPYGSKALLS